MLEESNRNNQVSALKKKLQEESNRIKQVSARLCLSEPAALRKK